MYENEEKSPIYSDNEEDLRQFDGSEIYYEGYHDFADIVNQIEPTGYIPTEEILIKQKEAIKRIKTKKANTMNDENNKENNDNNINNHINNNINNINTKDKIENSDIKNTVDLSNAQKKTKKQRRIFNGNFSVLTLNDNYFFEVSSFDPLNNNEIMIDDDSSPQFANNWKYVDSLFSNNNSSKNISKKDSNYLDLKHKAIRTINEVNYETNGVELNLNVTLRGESEIWIFTRCFVNRAVNESMKFDESSIHNGADDVFNKYSSVLKISKDKLSNRCFAIFGAFYENPINGSVIYKTFLKRQLVGHPLPKNTYPNICDLVIQVVDLGNEKIDSRIFLNGKERPNFVRGNFYLPMDKRAKILIAGVGDFVQVKKLVISNFKKRERNLEEENDNIDSIFSNEQKTCNCCCIF